MADNVVSNPGVGGATFASDDIGGVQYPRTKVVHGADGVATDCSAVAPLPVRPSDGTAVQTFTELDLDSGGGTVNRISVGIALPGAGGPVAGGTSANPLRTDPTGTTTQPVKGQDAHDATVSAPPLTIAFRANADEPTAVSANNDVTHAWGDLQGRLVTVSNHPAKVGNGTTHGPNSGTKATNGDTDAVGTPGASQSLYVTGLVVTNSNATGNQVQFKDGAGGVSGLNAWVTNTAPVAIQFNPPWKLTANTALVINCSAALATTYWTAHFFTAP